MTNHIDREFVTGTDGPNSVATSASTALFTPKQERTRLEAATAGIPAEAITQAIMRKGSKTQSHERSRTDTSLGDFANVALSLRDRIAVRAETVVVASGIVGTIGPKLRSAVLSRSDRATMRRRLAKNRLAVFPRRVRGLAKPVCGGCRRFRRVESPVRPRRCPIRGPRTMSTRPR